MIFGSQKFSSQTQNYFGKSRTFRVQPTDLKIFGPVRNVIKKNALSVENSTVIVVIYFFSLQLDPKVMNNISLHLRPEDREGLAPYKVNQALKPHPPPNQAKSQRIRQRPAKSKTVVTKDGRKLKPKSHKVGGLLWNV